MNPNAFKDYQSPFKTPKVECSELTNPDQYSYKYLLQNYHRRRRNNYQLPVLTDGAKAWLAWSFYRDQYALGDDRGLDAMLMYVTADNPPAAPPAKFRFRFFRFR